MFCEFNSRLLYAKRWGTVKGTNMLNLFRKGRNENRRRQMVAPPIMVWVCLLLLCEDAHAQALRRRHHLPPSPIRRPGFNDRSAIPGWPTQIRVDNVPRRRERLSDLLRIKGPDANAESSAGIEFPGVSSNETLATTESPGVPGVSPPGQAGANRNVAGPPDSELALWSPIAPN